MFGMVTGANGFQRPVAVDLQTSFRGDDEPAFHVDNEGVAWSIEKDPVTGEIYKVRM